MSRRRYRGRRQNRSGMFLVSTVVIVLMLMVSIKCVELKEKQDQYVVRQEELKQQIADEEARAEEFCYGDEENARIYAVHLMTADQSEICRASLVSVVNKKKQVSTTF